MILDRDDMLMPPPLERAVSVMIWVRQLLWMVAIIGALVGLVLIANKARAQSYTEIVTPMLGLSNTAQVAKDAPGAVLYVSCVNPNAATVYLRLYDSAGVVVVGTTASKVTIAVSSSSATGLVSPSPSGALYFSAGIQAAVTTTATGGSAPATAVPCDIAHR